MNKVTLSASHRASFDGNYKAFVGPTDVSGTEPVYFNCGLAPVENFVDDFGGNVPQTPLGQFAASNGEVRCDAIVTQLQFHCNVVWESYTPVP